MIEKIILALQADLCKIILKLSGSEPKPKPGYVGAQPVSIYCESLMGLDRANSSPFI